MGDRAGMIFIDRYGLSAHKNCSANKLVSLFPHVFTSFLSLQVSWIVIVGSLGPALHVFNPCP